MEKNKLYLALLIFLLGMSSGFIIAGVYNVYEFNKAHKLLLERECCTCQTIGEKIGRTLNITLNIT